jgi:AraC family transcriptional regulator, arabinose operon regulatory protein
MRLVNYMNLNQYPIRLSFQKDRTYEFDEIYHSHQGVELLYVHSGTGRVITGGNIIDLKKGVLLIFRPFYMHSIKINTQEEHYIRSLFVFEPSVIQQYLKPFYGLHSLFHELIINPFSQATFLEIPEEKVNYLADEFKRQLSESKSSEKLEIEALFLVSFVNLIRNHISKDTGDYKTGLTSRTADPIRSALDWLENHFSEEFKLKTLADAVHLSANHLSYLFHKETGSCISDYLAVRRIQEACLLLRTTSLTVEAVGNKIGLSNFSYFCKFFKQYTGMTPYNFKKNQVKRLSQND